MGSICHKQIADSKINSPFIKARKLEDLKSQKIIKKLNRAKFFLLLKIKYHSF